MWHPPKELVKQSNVKKFMEKHGIEDYRELVRQSTEDVEWFWGAAEKELSVEWFQNYTTILDQTKGVQWAKWFIDGQLNVTHNCVDKHSLSARKSKIAFIWSGEDGHVRKVSYKDLNLDVNKFANGLKKMKLYNVV